MRARRTRGESKERGFKKLCFKQALIKESTIQKPGISTSVMATEHLHLKLLERKIQKFALALSGIVRYEIIKASGEDFPKQRQVVAESCTIDSGPLCRWPQPIDEQLVLAFLSERISNLSLEVYIPCERPFLIKAVINDSPAFIRSIWRVEGTKDVTLYIKSLATVIQVQDLEYELAYFEVGPKPGVSTAAS